MTQPDTTLPMGAEEFRRCVQTWESTVTVINARGRPASGLDRDSDRFALGLATGPADVHGALLAAHRLEHLAGRAS